MFNNLHRKMESDNSKSSSIQLGCILLFLYFIHVSIFRLRYIYGRQISAHIRYYMELAIIVKLRCMVVIYIMMMIFIFLQILCYILKRIPNKLYKWKICFIIIFYKNILIILYKYIYIYSLINVINLKMYKFFIFSSNIERYICQWQL